MIRIRSKRHNFRRCGMPHPKEPVDYPDDRFTLEELKILGNETMLIVEIIPDEPELPPETETEIESKPEEVAEESVSEEVADITLEAGGDIVIREMPDIDAMTVAQIKAKLDALGIEYDDKARKAELFALLAHSNTAHSS